jgi:hypothetical protein
MEQHNRTRQQNNTVDAAKIATALHRGDHNMATLLVAHHVKHLRVIRGASIATATDEVYSICARAYEETYRDRQGFEAMWDDVEDGVRRILD